MITHVGGRGLNLTSADTAIFLEHDYTSMGEGLAAHALARNLIPEPLPGHSLLHCHILHC